MMKRYIIIMCSCAALLSGCSSGLKQENEALKEEIAQRREALDTNQQQEIAALRQQLAVTDSLLTVAKREHDEQHEWVMAHATELADHSPEVLRLNRLRARLDSLQVEFGSQAQKLKTLLHLVEKRQRQE